MKFFFEASKNAVVSELCLHAVHGKFMPTLCFTGADDFSYECKKILAMQEDCSRFTKLMQAKGEKFGRDALVGLELLKYF